MLAQDFDLVVPDMPGFGYSDTPPAAPLNSREVAGPWAELMTELGYEKFFAAGGDIGSDVSRYLALDYPGRVTAVHRMSAGLPPPRYRCHRAHARGTRVVRRSALLDGRRGRSGRSDPRCGCTAQMR